MIKSLMRSSFNLANNHSAGISSLIPVEEGQKGNYLQFLPRLHLCGNVTGNEIKVFSHCSYLAFSLVFQLETFDEIEVNSFLMEKNVAIEVCLTCILFSCSYSCQSKDMITRMPNINLTLTWCLKCCLVRRILKLNVIIQGFTLIWLHFDHLHILQWFCSDRNFKLLAVPDLLPWAADCLSFDWLGGDETAEHVCQIREFERDPARSPLAIAAAAAVQYFLITFNIRAIMITIS